MNLADPAASAERAARASRRSPPPHGARDGGGLGPSRRCHIDPDYIAALIELHRGLERLGPGDIDVARGILGRLPPLPAQPRIADLGCGSGAGALLLADHFQATVVAVDAAPDFIEELAVRAERAGLGRLITPVVADMGALDWPPASVDLLWSEGAAYTLGFERALVAWRPLLPTGGVAVVSELSWFGEERPGPALAFWQAAYPSMGSERENLARAAKAGFAVLEAVRLPADAWWTNYYNPLRERMEQLPQSPKLAAVVQETREEMSIFERFSTAYGYTFYVLQAVEHLLPLPPLVLTSSVPV